MMSALTISQLVTIAFRTALSRRLELYQTWVAKSHHLGSLLPDSLLIASIQQVGELDVLVRCLEDEAMPPVANSSELDTFSLSYKGMLSTLWVGSIYEICRVLDGRKLVPDSNELKTLAHELRLLRIPLEKHEIAKDCKLRETLQIMRVPPSGEERDRYSYSKDDERRAHIMPSGISDRGSYMWQVIDIPSQRSYWIERRSLSDRFLAL